MNVYQVKKTEPRLEFPPFNNLKITGYGKDNLYPQKVKELVSCSETGEGCLKRYIDFIQGNGFKDESFARLVVNDKGETADSILQQISDDLGSSGGFALHVNYNLLGNIVEISHIPFENCRLGEEDDIGQVAQIAIHPDWTGKKKRNNKTLKPTVDTIDYIDIFNPFKRVILSQIENAGTIEQYKGQVLWFSSAGGQEYPKAIYDKVVTQMSTEEGLGNIALRNTRNNFTPTTVLVTKRGQDTPKAKGEDNDSEISEFDDSIAQAIGELQGDHNTNKILHLEVEHEDDLPIVLDLQGKNYDKDFTVTSDTVCEKIYAAFGQEAFHRIRKGSVGFSSDIMRDTYDMYSSVTDSERRMIERIFDKIMKLWHEPVQITDYSIKPLIFISSQFNNTSTSENEGGGGGVNDPLAVKIGVGGTQAMTEIMIGNMSSDKKASLLKILFNLSDKQIQELT